MGMKYFEDLNAGDSWTLAEYTVDHEEMLAYARANDPWPFHVDPEAATRSPFGGLIASGGYTITLMYRLFHEIVNQPDRAWAFLGGFSAIVPVETCVKMVRLLADRPEFQETEETRSMLANKLIKSRVRAALGDSTSLPITISVAQGKVTLTGTTIGPISNVEQLVRDIPGVTEVENRVVAVRSGVA